MPALLCRHCGQSIADSLAHCPFCGADVTGLPYAGDEHDFLLHQLLDAARRYQQEGDIAAALRCAREALAIRHESSAAHALLGRLYELQGNSAAAQYHFQNALQIEITPAAVEAPILPAPMSANTPRRSQTGVVIFLLIACVLFSGLAAVFAVFRPNREAIHAQAFLQSTLNRPALSSVPRWTWTVPSPLPMVTPKAVVNPTPPPAAGTVQVAVRTVEENPAPPTKLTEPQPTADPTVLGPSAHMNMGSESGKPTLEAADQAYFRGEFDHAIVLYEAILAQEDISSPRLYQDLAWCYQQMGNSPKATEHLQKAIQGYRTILDKEPDSTAAQQGLASCEAALNTLLNSRN